MTTALSNHASESLLTDAETTLFSTTSSEDKFIGTATFRNTSTNPVEVTLWRIGLSTTGTEGSGGNEFDVFTIPARVTVHVDTLIGHTLAGSMKISGKASTTGVVSYDVSGTTET